MSLIKEIKRRNVFRMVVLYAIAAWLIMQVAEVIIDLANLPDWIGPSILGLLAVGLPIALIFSWFYELTPEGISLEKDVDPAESITHVTGRRLDFIVISLLCAAVILFAYDKWWTRGPPEKSIAVLPFVNMSDDTSNEYFSDGISEELLNLLATIPELRVISRSSAFSYKGKQIDIPTVAAQLNVAHVLEGSVRKAGNQVRITAQLIEARTDTHLWSETYDRTLDDIFATQDEIAAKVVEQLKITLLSDAPTVRATDPEAYALYLQARHLFRMGTAEGYEQSNALFEQALGIDPGFAAAWVGLSTNYARQVDSSVRPADEGYRLSREMAQKAVLVDPDFALAHAALGWIAIGYDNNLTAAARHYEHALALAPASITIIADAAVLLLSLGRLDEAIALHEYTIARDPVDPTGHYNYGIYNLYAGRWDAAIDSLRTALRLSPDRIGAHYWMGAALLLKGEAQAALEEFAQEKGDEEYRAKGTTLALHALGRQDEFEAALAKFEARWGEIWPSEVAHVYAWTGDAAAAYAWLDKSVAQNEDGLSGQFAIPWYTPLLDDPRWAAFLERTGSSQAQLNAIAFTVTLPE